MRNEIAPPLGTKKWTKKYWDWLNKLTLERAASHLAFQEYLQQLKEYQHRIKVLEQEIENQAQSGAQAPLIQALMTLRGVAVITATSLVAEIGSFKRFSAPKQFMAYNGLVPSESSSGTTRQLGEITKTGNGHVRKLLIEAAWSYRFQPQVKGSYKSGKKINQAIFWESPGRLRIVCTKGISV